MFVFFVGMVFCLYTQKPVHKKKVIKLGIQANMIFFYYKDLEKAKDFYGKILGFRPVLDYGFAKAYQISHTTFLCLVDETKGMHKTSEPKTVTLSFITRDVDAWYKYLKSQGVKMHSPLKGPSNRPYRGFVAYDCEGYFLEFETFQDHPQNKKLLPILKKHPAIYPKDKRVGSRPKGLGIQGTVFWLYYRDLEKAQKFCQDILKLEFLVKQDFARIFASSPTGFIGLVDESRGLHRFSKVKSVNIGFITENVENWYHYLLKRGLKMREPLEEIEKGRVRAFVTFDVAGYFLEFDKFYKCKENEILLKTLNKIME